MTYDNHTGFYRCDHLNPHEGYLSDHPNEVWFRMVLKLGGWLDAGYCYLYYPEWLYRSSLAPFSGIDRR